MLRRLILSVFVFVDLLACLAVWLVVVLLLLFYFCFGFAFLFVCLLVGCLFVFVSFFSIEYLEIAD